MRKVSWRGALVALGAAAAVVAVAVGFTVHKSASDIHIAMIAPLTGPYVFVGGPERDAATKAVAEINAHGGIKGHKLVMDVFDDASTPPQSVQLTQQVLSDPKFIAMIGTGFGSAALAGRAVGDGTDPRHQRGGAGRTGAADEAVDLHGAAEQPPPSPTTWRRTCGSTASRRSRCCTTTARTPPRARGT